ncbi:hypothetical protein TWF569_008298 [Orbilia oligospora]|uniref:Uncharacterized protein n=1 Tax=Orbilia oligospora TaxID=2813651 RepID=A0A7C8JD63_ORBOL|nr:hypothetical protein TWF706_006967 [Orbilia oligospora]KAF3112051.1 hypothetical protein TWF102_005798 [Orbilia oligospora]KAF3113285.1 hypothetical protein TWF103_002449 [Orbilia oligospora]KAF3140157.1 hypothetical protein TWF569_008298 [Orbilia oligospora]
MSRLLILTTILVSVFLWRREIKMQGAVAFLEMHMKVKLYSTLHRKEVGSLVSVQRGKYFASSTQRGVVIGDIATLKSFALALSKVSKLIKAVSVHQVSAHGICSFWGGYSSQTLIGSTSGTRFGSGDKQTFRAFRTSQYEFYIHISRLLRLPPETSEPYILWEILTEQWELLRIPVAKGETPWSAGKTTVLQYFGSGPARQTL